MQDLGDIDIHKHDNQNSRARTVFHDFPILKTESLFVRYSTLIDVPNLKVPWPVGNDHCIWFCFFNRDHLWVLFRI